MVLETSNVCSAGSVHVAAKATLTQLLTAVAEKLHYKPNTMVGDCTWRSLHNAETYDILYTHGAVCMTLRLMTYYIHMAQSA